MKLLVLALLCYSGAASALSVSLERGNTIEEITLRGIVRITCRTGQQNRTRTTRANCYDSLLAGGSYGTIVLNNGSIDADYVKIKNVKSRWVKTLNWNSETGSTRNNLNLWNRSLTQRAKLHRGLNNLTYRFYKNDIEIAAGEFQINVTEGESRYCRTRSIFNSFCTPSAGICSQYFYQQNDCK